MTTRVEIAAQDDTTVSIDDVAFPAAIEIGIEADGEGLYALLDIDTAKQLLAALAVAIARAEMQS